MSWRRYFTPVNSSGSMSPVSGKTTSKANPARTNYSSYLPDVYAGHPNRLERYGQFDTMDTDSEVNAALDILAEFCTQENQENGTPFQIFFKDQATSTEVKIIKKYLQQWSRLNKFDKRIFKIIRNAFKYGDVFFVRDPETQAWMYIDPAKVDRIIVNESEGKKPEQYHIRDFNPNLETLSATAINPSNLQGGSSTFGGAYGSGTGGAGGSRGMVGSYPTNISSTRFTQNQNQYAIDARHVIHISMSEGLDNNYPFGNSLLESIFKVFKQKELLEDAIIIYRVQRAPERRVFYIDVGNMPTHLAMSFVERVKNEVNQRRIPSVTGGSQTVVDSSYNPLCLDLSTKIPLLDGRILCLSELIEEFNNGKENWTYSCNPTTGEIVPGLINWAGITRKNTEVIKLTFDNGKELICTPDHKIPVFGKGFIQAQDLTKDDSLIAFNRRFEKMQGKGEYEQVWDHNSKSWKWTHRIVGQFFRDRQKHQEFTYLEEYITTPKAVIHHKDYNRFNNDPRNLFYMTKEDHILYHAAQKKDFWKTLSDEQRQKLVSKISNTAKLNWENMTEEQRLSALWNIRSAQKQAVWLRQNDPDAAMRYRINASASRKRYLQENPEFKKKLISNLEKRIKIKNQSLNLTFDMLQIVADKVKQGYTNKNQVIELCDNDSMLLELVKNNNSTPLNYANPQCKIDFEKFGYSKINRLLKKFGYKNWKTFVKEIDNFNHRIVKIEKVSNRDVGTLTIDGKEQWHNYHTFAIESGIFVKNSINEDYFFPQTCLALDQKIRLLDGRDLTLAEIIKEFDNGKENWVYAINQITKEIEPGRVAWAGKTRLNTQLVEVLLDNGEKIKVTPDHRFIMRDGSEIEAQYLASGDSVMPLYLHDATTGKHQGSGKYLKYTCNSTGKKKWVHTMVCPKNNPGKETEIHHKDLNSLNNNPTNLIEMNTQEHRALHRELGSYHLTSAWNDSIKRKNLTEGIRRYHSSVTEHDRLMFRNRGKKNGAATWANPESSSRVLASLENTCKRVSKQKTVQYTDKMCARVVDLYNQGFNSISKLSSFLRTDKIFQDEFKKANPNLLRDRNRPDILLPTDKTLVKIAQHLGYKGWNDFKENYKSNHKVVSVAWLEQREDTGDITVESASNAHNFALTAGVFVHNSEGRGSKVDILPGGTNLGEIDDLKYFTNKLFRALRIPSSYLPTGPDDGGSNFNDGRVGTAFIQELRFNKYCERLQSLVNDTFDNEFKLYLRNKGINIDNNIFDLKFNPPQNFAAYRQSEMDTARVTTFGAVVEIPFMSKRFAMKRFLGLTSEEIAENEQLWKEENIDTDLSLSASAELRSQGITANAIVRDIEGLESAPAEVPPEELEPGTETAKTPPEQPPSV